MPNVKKSSSPDFPSIAKKILNEHIEASGESGICKLPAGLFVVATPIGHRGDITLRALITLASVDYIACEDTRTSGALFAAYGIKKPLLSYTEHNDAGRTPHILELIQQGKSVALVSDAGLPLIADPGQRLVAMCIQHQLSITVIPGANAALTALAASGLSTSPFFFAGFLPNKSSQRQKTLRELSALNATLIFYESPQRLAEMLDDLGHVWGADCHGAVGRELTKIYEDMRRGTVGELAAHYHAHPPKGEIVVMVSRNNLHKTITTPQDVDALLKEALKHSSVRDAAAIVAEASGHKKKDVYARALEISKKTP